jgi:hypothetical protein
MVLILERLQARVLGSANDANNVLASDVMQVEN